MFQPEKPYRRFPLVRKSHYEAVAYMGSPLFDQIRRLFCNFEEFGGVYFRPTHKGIVAVDLKSDSLKPRIGIGPAFRPGTSLQTLTVNMPRRIEMWREKQRDANGSLENRLEAQLIRYAQANQLRLPGFPDQLRFIHSQWRLVEPDMGKPIGVVDLTLVDIVTACLVTMELKVGSSKGAFFQITRYMAWFRTHAIEINPFFLRLARVMGNAYGCAELAQIQNLYPAEYGLVACRDGHGNLMIEQY